VKWIQREAVIDTGKRRESTVEFLWELMSCWLLAVGTSLLQNVQLPYPLPTIDILWQTALTVVLLALFSRRWFLMVIVTVQALLLGLLAMLLFQLPIAESLADAVAFCGWFFEGMPYDEVWSTGSGMTVLHVLLNIGISMLMFFVVRVSRGAWPPLVLCFSLLILIMTFGDSTNNAAATAAFLAGCCPMIARDRYSGRRLFSGEEKYRAMGTRWGVSTASGALCLSAAVVLLMLIPVDTDALRVRWCSELAADFQSFTHWFTNQQKKTDVLTLEDLGLQPYPDRLGGNLEQKEPQTLATTDLKESTLVRMTSYDTFDGENWSAEFTPAYRYDGPFSGTQQELMGNTAMEGEMSGALSALVEQQKMTVTLAADTVILPSASQVTGFTENTETNNPLLFNGRGELLSFFGYDAGYSYTLTNLQYPTFFALEGKDLDRFVIAATIGEDDYYDDGEELAPYLTLPEDYSEEAAALAKYLTEHKPSQLEAAIALCKYFSITEEFQYTDHPGPLRSGENIVDKLLESQRGYSVYYATTMATMARAAGIPSRLVAGYRTAPDTTGAYVIDASQPYAWVECYIRTLGWVSFDPAPREATNALPNSQIQPVEKEVPDENVQDPDDHKSHPTVEGPSRWLSTLLLVLLLVALGLWVARTLLIHKLYALPVVSKLLRSPTAKAHLYYRDILRQIRYIHRPLRRGETVLEWLEDASATGELPDTLASSLEPMMALLYGNRPMTGEQVEALADTHTVLEPLVRAHTRMDLYWLHRRILRPWLNRPLFASEWKERRTHHDPKA